MIWRSTLKCRELCVALYLGCMCAVSAFAQGPGGAGQMPQAQQVPLSGRSEGAADVQVQQSGAGSASSSVNTVNSTVQVQGNYTGSVSADLPGTGPVDLNFAQAIRLGLQYNLGGLASDASSRQLRAQRLSALSALLPNIYGTISETGAKTDLQTTGLSSSVFGGGIKIPTVVGPYHYYSLAGNVAEQLSLTDVHNLRAANASREAALLNARDARELIVVAVGGFYLRVLTSIALVESQEVQVQSAEASYKQAIAQAEAGTKADIDANRSLVELQTEQQRLSSERGDLIKQKIQLARIIGISPGRELRLVEKLPSEVQQPASVDDAVNTAELHRADLKAAELQVKAAEEAYRASKAEYLPSATVNGAYGLQAVNPNKGEGVFQASATLTVPIWNSGRTKADIEQADASVRQRKAEAADKHGAVEAEVRSALVDLDVASHQVQVAESNRKLAKNTLQQSLDRFSAGVSDSVEVVQSQESLASAERDYISSLFSLNLSRISLARATGNAEDTIPDMLKGK
jgi:outer membrane protein TolC